jgi:hypothetical protein
MITRRRKATLLALLALSPLPAFAYVDPGSGMLIWQGLLAVIGAVIVFVRNPWESVKRLLDRFRRK